MEKILFIVPPNIEYIDFVNPPKNVKSIHKQSKDYGILITEIPLGILSLVSYVKKYSESEVEFKLIDFNIILNKLDNFYYKSFKEFFYEFLKKEIEIEGSPSIIGISSLFTPSYKSMLEIASCCSEISKNSIIIAGGGVPTNMANEIFGESDDFDALCYGEGEEPLLDLVNAKNKIECLENSSCWITQSKIKNKYKNYTNHLIENLDKIPPNDYSILDLEGYKLNPTILSYNFIDNKEDSFPLMTSRGCPYHCCFCSSHSVHGRKMRYYSLERVREDIKNLKEKYGARVIIFQDDHFMFDEKRVFNIIDILREFQMTAFFPNSLALYTLKRKMLEALKSVGVNQLVLSIESGSDRVLKEVMHKPLNLSIVKQVADDCRSLNIYTDINLLIGLPGEKKQDIEDARTFLKTIGANWFRINVATPLVGSEMFDICIKKNYFIGNYLECNYKRAMIETEDFTKEYIQEMAYIMNLELNFVNNSDFLFEDYKTALKGFENAIKAKSDHVLAYYYTSKCYEKLGETKKAEDYLEMAKRNLRNNSFWQKYVDMFSIPIKA
jgi:anaerobic magnesium-protoporphyrin IX monomethyl ester cyclase